MNNKVTFNEIVESIAEATSTSKRVCELFVRELFSTISQALIDGESVKIKGIGTFKITKVKSRKSVSVSTGETINIGEHSKLSFTPDKALAEAVNQPFAQFETVFLDDAVTDEKLADIDRQYPSLFEQETQQEVEPAAEPEQETESGLADAKEPEPEQQNEPEPEAELEPEPEKPHRAPAMAVPIPDPESETEQQEKPAPAEPSETVEANPVSRPMLVGIPIDGPSQPVPEPEPEEETGKDDYFYRPAPRNAYTPTPEQLESMPRKRGGLQWQGDKQWLLLVIGIVIGCLLSWLLMKACNKVETSSPVEKTVVATDSVPYADTVVVEQENPDVITETVTTQVVLSTLAAKHYGSQWFWVYIYEENKDIIDNPDNVPPGTKVVIPPAEKYGINAKDPKSVKKAQRRSWEILTLGKR